MFEGNSIAAKERVLVTTRSPQNVIPAQAGIRAEHQKLHRSRIR
jgi:hypothetical protein